MVWILLHSKGLPKTYQQSLYVLRFIPIYFYISKQQYNRQIEEIQLITIKLLILTVQVILTQKNLQQHSRPFRVQTTADHMTYVIMLKYFYCHLVASCV